MTGSPLAVLIVEDSEDDTELVLDALRHGGFEPAGERVETSGEMREALSEKAWDVVTCDDSMPQFSAAAALDVLKQSGRDVPFIIVSGVLETPGAVELLKAGADDFVSKKDMALLAPTVGHGLREVEARRKREEAERALREREAQIRAIFDHTPVCLNLKDTEGRYLLVNKPYEEWMGLPAEEILGRKAGEFLEDAIEVEDIAAAERAVVETGEAVDREIRARRPDGKIHHRIAIKFPVKSPNGSISVIGTVAVDITDRKRAEEALRESEIKFRAMAASAHDALIAVDDSGRIAFWNPAAERMFGYTQDEAMDAELHALIAPPCYHKKFAKGFRRFVETGKGPLIDAVTEIEGRRKDGGEFPMELSLSAAKLDGRWTAFAAIRDVTVRKRAEEIELESERVRQDVLLQTIDAITRTVEARDPYIAGHEERVSRIADAIAEEMGFAEDRREGLRLAARIHDIGKLQVPMDILNRPGRLSEAEFALIKVHSQVGYDILKGIDFPWPVAEMVRQHHERIDGSGYPDGLKGDDMLLESKILGVADVVEAIASHRPYRAALGIDTAMLDLVQGKGSLYDPDVVDCCVRLFKEKGFSLS